MSDEELRRSAAVAVKRLDELGLNRGSSGNLSLRSPAGGFWITPTGMAPQEIAADSLVRLADDGTVKQGDWAPSTEWPLHCAIYLARPDLHAVVHTHSPHATALACLRRPLPAVHYMVAIAGGDDVPCTPYHLFGSDALSAAVADAFKARDACLLANHGLVAGGATLAQAMKVALEVEALAGIYLQTLAAGAPVLLSDAQMAEVIERFRSYGSKRRAR